MRKIDSGDRKAEETIEKGKVGESRRETRDEHSHAAFLGF